MLHAGPGWSRDQLEAPPDAVIRAMLDAFAGLAGRALPAPDRVQAHRWRYARVTVPLGASCLASDDGLVACGDWCLGARVESAWLSGHEAALRMRAR